MENLNITKGVAKAYNIELGDYSTSCVGIDKKSAICHLYYEGIKITDEAKANAALIAQTFNVTNQCGFRPKQLLEQRDILLEVVKIGYFICNKRTMPTESEIEALLNDFKKVIEKTKK